MIFEETGMTIAFVIVEICSFFIKYVLPFIGIITSIYWIKIKKNKKWCLVMGVSILWLITAVSYCFYSAFLIQNLSLNSLS